MTVNGTDRTINSVNVLAQKRLVSLSITTNPLTAGQTVTVSYDPSDAGGDNKKLRDPAGNEVVSFTNFAVTNAVGDTAAPAFASAAVDGTALTVTFNELLNWTVSPAGSAFTVSATPSGGSARSIAGTGTVALSGKTAAVTLASAVAAGETVTVAYTKPASGDVVEDPAGNDLATFSGESVTNNTAAAGGAGGQGDAGPASVTGVSVVSGAGADRTYGLGDIIRVRVSFDGPVDVTGTPRLKIDMDPAEWGEKWAAYESGGGTGSLTFAHTVVEPNISTQGIAVLANTLALNGGTIRAGGADAGLAHDGLAHDADHKVDWRTAGEESGPGGTSGDSGPPTVTGVSVVSSPASGSTYMLGETIRIRATFSEAVTVTGAPRLSIDMDPAHWGTKQAAYAGGSGTSSLTFAHTVVEPNYSTQGIAVLANTLALNGGTIRSAGGTSAVLGHTGLGHDSNHKVDWRPTISVADARANEGAGAKAAFEVSLSRAFTSSEHRVTVDYATADGTAKAGEDYTATSGTLTFAPGETAKTVNVPILDDALDEGEETFVLRLSNATGGRIADGEATGTIVNDDPIPTAWLARFGRTVAEQSVDAIRERMSADRTPGFRGRIAGEALPSVTGTGTGAAADLAEAGTETADGAGMETADATDADPFAIPEFSEGERLAFLALLAPQEDEGEDGAAEAGQTRSSTAEEAMLGTAFEIMRETDGGLSLGLWGRVARSGFSGREEQMDFDGDVTSAMLGTDWTRREALFGLMLFRSRGEGGYAGPTASGTIEADLTGLVPWAGRRKDGAPTIWGAAGTGRGEMTLAPEGRDEPFVAGLDWSMAAAGADGVPVTVAALGDASLRWRADALMTRTDSEAVPGLDATSATTTRLRLGLESAWSRALASGGTLVPRLEIGLRRDGGDAETGVGIEAGGGVRYRDPGRGLSVSFDGRALALHEDRDLKDWGLAVSMSWDPRPDTRLGPSVIATRGWGGAPTGGVAALLEPEAIPGADDGTGGGTGSLGLEMAWGTDLSAWRHGMTGSAYGRVTGSPDAEDLRLGWRLAPDLAFPESLNHDFWMEPGTAGDAAVGAGLSWSRERQSVRSSRGIDLGAREGGGIEAGFRLTREW